MISMLKQIKDDFWVLKDTCNVYILRYGTDALVIDAGSGAMLNRLADIGVERIEMVLLTHYHWDQCFGAQAFIDHGSDVRACVDDKPYLGLKEVQSFWREHYPLADSTTAYLVTLQGNKGIRCDLEAGMKLQWKTFQIEVVNASGHTSSQLAYLIHHPEGSILCSGDAVYSGGKVWSAFCMDWDHWTNKGVVSSLQTVESFAQLEPSVVVPSHGDILDLRVNEQLHASIEGLTKLKDYKSFQSYSQCKEGLTHSPRIPYINFFLAEGVKAQSISKRLWVQDNSYFLFSEFGGCLMIDSGYPYMRQFVPSFLAMVKCEKVDVVIPTHAHCDHVDGIAAMKQLYDTKVWCLDVLADALEHSNKYLHPWSRWEKFTIDRTFSDGEVVQWNEYVLKFHRYPGQTSFANAVETVVDGKKMLFSGDNFFPVEQWTGTGGVMGLNRGLPDGYQYSAEKTLEISPDWILPGHEFPFYFDQREFELRAAWAAGYEKLMEELTPTGNDNACFDPHRISVYPFMSTASPGADIFLNIFATGRIRNQYEWYLPDGFEVVPVSHRDKDNRSEKVQSVRICVPVKLDKGRYVGRVSDQLSSAIFILDIL